MIGDEEALAAVQGAHASAARELPHGGRSAQRTCVLRAGPPGAALAMLGDLADLFEQAAANGTPVREIVGEDPVEFAEAFVRNYPQGLVDRPRAERLTSAIEPPPEKTPEAKRMSLMTTRTRRSACRALRSRTRSCTCCAAWTSTWPGAASSPCSAPTAPARPRS